MFFTKKDAEKMIADAMAAFKTAEQADWDARRAEIEASLRQRIEEYLAEEKQKKMESKEPYIEIIGERVTADGTVEITLDYNPAFVALLRSKGYTGPTDQSLVDMWLSTISRQIGAEIGQKSFE